MSDASIEIIPSRDDENVNLLNFVPTSPTSGDAGSAAADKPLSPKRANSTVSTNVNGMEKFLAYTAAKLGSQNSLVESLKRGHKIGGLTTPRSSSLSTSAYASLMRTSEIDSKFLSVSTSTPSSTDNENDVTNSPAWSHPKSSPSASNLQSPDDISKFRAIVSPVREDHMSISNEMDEIMAFRANSSDSDNTVEVVDSSPIPHDKPSSVERPEDCLSITSMRVLPPIMESKSQETADDKIEDILSHQGTECMSVNSDVSENNADGSIEVLDDGSISIVGLSQAMKANAESPRNKLNLKVAVTPDKAAAEEIDDLNQMLDVLSNDPCDEGPISPLFSPLAGENILASPKFNPQGLFSPRRSEASTSPRAPLSPKQPEASTSPRAVLSPIQIGKPTSPRGLRSPKKSTDMSTLRGILSYVKSDLPSKTTSPKQCRDPPSQLLEVNEKMVNHRFTVKSAVVEATQLKGELDVMTKREDKVKQQSELESEMTEVAHHYEAFPAEVKKLEVMKADIEKARREIENETAELEQLKKEHFSRCDELEKELILENQALRGDIERLISTKKELAEAKFKAEKERSESQKLQKEYEIQLRVLETEKQKLGEAMDRATAETSEINELSRTALIELSRHKKSVEADMIIVRENHESSLKIALDEKEILQAATTKAERETKEAKEQLASMKKEHDAQMELLEKEKEALVKATEEAAKQTTETKEMTRTVFSELEEYKVKLEVDMQNETKDLKAKIRRMEEEHEKIMEKLAEKSETLQSEITSEQKEVGEMVKGMEESIESLHQRKENLENELTLRIESVHKSTDESKRELHQELNKARFSKARSRFDMMRGHAKESLKCATVDMISYNVESFTQAAMEVIAEPFSDDLLIKQAKDQPTVKKNTKKLKQQSRFRHTRSQSAVITRPNSKTPNPMRVSTSPQSQRNGITRQTSSSSLQGKVISPREILL